MKKKRPKKALRHKRRRAATNPSPPITLGNPHVFAMLGGVLGELIGRWIDKSKTAPPPYKPDDTLEQAAKEVLASPQLPPLSPFGSEPPPFGGDPVMQAAAGLRWTPSWYVDPSNTTGSATDSNTPFEPSDVLVEAAKERLEEDDAEKE